MDKDKYVLGIESSCDEAAIGIIKDSNVIYKDLYSSAAEQAKYGGVIPEIASRLHEKNFNKMLKKMNSEFDLSKITDIAYTAYPGLIGGLHVAKVFAETLGWYLNIKPIPVNHIHGHIFSAMIGKEEIKYPFLALVVSGKTSSIFKVDSPSKIIELVKTTDDAAGETLDKIGRKLGIPYPAGKEIDEIFKEELANIKLINHLPKDSNFSFSGFKTSILNLIEKNKHNQLYERNQILSSVMLWIINEMIIKLRYYGKKYEIDTVYVGGGVSASRTLKKLLLKEKWIKHLHLTDLPYTGDNGVMIAYFAEKLINEKNSNL